MIILFSNYDYESNFYSKNPELPAGIPVPGKLSEMFLIDSCPPCLITNLCSSRLPYALDQVIKGRGSPEALHCTVTFSPSSTMVDLDM